MKRGITIKDLAKALNISVSGVSKALNGGASIGEETRSRVKELATQLNYVPNQAARHFKNSRSYKVAVIIPNLSDPFYAGAIHGIEEKALEQQYNLVITQSYEDPEKEKTIVDNLIRQRVEGVIITISIHTKALTYFRKLEEAGIPVVYFVREPQEPVNFSVYSDTEPGTLAAVALLVQKGHTRIAHIQGPSTIMTCNLQHQEYKKGLLQNKVPYHPELVREVNTTQAATFAAMAELLQLKNPPTAIITFRNTATLDALLYLKQNHPEKLKSIDFIGYAPIPLIEYLDHKPLASILGDPKEIGTEAMKLLFKRIEASEIELAPEQIQLPCKLVMH